MKLTHTSLTKLGRFLNYPSLDKGGMCRGFSAMLALAILAKDEQSFYTRLDLIEKYQHNFNQLSQDIKQIRVKLQKDGQGSLNEKEWALLEVPAFFEGTKVYLHPEDDSSLFNNTYINQGNFKAIYSLVHSKELEHEDISILLEKDFVFDRVGLENWLADLASAVSTTKSPVPILLDSHNHTVCFNYSTDKQCWIYTDTNDFERFPNKKEYYRELNTQEFAESIFRSFFDDLTGNTAFCSTALAINPEESLKKTMKSLELKYAIKPEDAFRYNSDGAGLLFIASQKVHHDEINKLLEYTVEVNQATVNKGFTPLQCASENGDLEVVCKLLKSGAKVNHEDKEGITPLHSACLGNHFDVVCKLLESGAEVNQETKKGCTALHIACYKGNLDMVCKLLESGAKVNRKAYVIACLTGHIDVARKLFEHSRKNYYKQSGGFFSPKTMRQTAATVAVIAGGLYLLSRK